MKQFDHLLHAQVNIQGLYDLDFDFYFRIRLDHIIEFRLDIHEEYERLSQNIIGRFEFSEEPGKEEIIQYLKDYILGGRNFIGLGYTYMISTFISQQEFKELQEEIMADLMKTKKLGEEKWRNSPIVKLCKEYKLELHPNPEYDHIMDCRCPSGYSHRLTINARSGSWFCGYCQVKGYVGELRKHIEEELNIGDKGHIEREEPFTYKVNDTTYIDEDRLKLQFSTLIIRVESINRHFGPLSSYFAETSNFVITNGKLLLMYEMNDPPHFLIQFAEEKLMPLGLCEHTDYVFADERWVKDSPDNPDPM